MATLNKNYLKLQAGYLFPEIGKRTKAFAAANPDAKLMRLGIGNTTEPLTPTIVKALSDAVDKLAKHLDAFHRSGSGCTVFQRNTNRIADDK